MLSEQTPSPLVNLEKLQEHDELIKQYIDSNSSTTTYDMLCEMYNVYTQESEESDGSTKITEEVKNGETVVASRVSTLSADLTTVTEVTTIGTETQTKITTINEASGTVTVEIQT